MPATAEELTMKCSVKNCPRQASPGYKQCETCRIRKRAYLAHYRQRMDPVALAYRERHRPHLRQLTREWTERNQERRKLLGKLTTAIARGKITKPDHCQDCGKAGRIVAWGIQDGIPPTVQAWVCWKCWRARWA